MNEFLKYLKMIPVIIYPYIYVLILAIFLLFAGILPEDYTDVALIGLLIVAVIYNLYSFIIVIVNAVQAAKGIMTARQAARMNLIIKCVQIPAYIMHFILGFKRRACIPARCHLHGSRMFYLLRGCGDRHCVCCESPEEISC